MNATRHDVIIVGGGLAGGLGALALKARHPDLDVLLIEPGEKIGGNHLWSFFQSDVDEADHDLIEPLIVHRWPAYDVVFPRHRRQLDQPYRTIESERLDGAVRAALPPDRIVRAKASTARPASVDLDDGSTLWGRTVLDARGLGAAPTGLDCGWQKFCGQLLRIDAGHGVDAPVVMDATVDQADGYRFVYLLPFSDTEIFVEDTYYSDTAGLDRAELARRIARYADQRGWTVNAVLREESGVLPVVKRGNFDRFWPKGDLLARAGVRAGLFHPLTSYSLPDAVRFAGWLSREAPLDYRLGAATRALAADHWKRGKLDRLLTRLLFDAADPPQRYKVLQRFYRLPAGLIERFYAGRSTVADGFRILIGRPPVAISRALRVIADR